MMPPPPPVSFLVAEDDAPLDESSDFGETTLLASLRELDELKAKLTKF